MDSLVRIFELHQAVADLVIQQANFAGGLFDRGVLKAFSPKHTSLGSTRC